MEKANFLDIDHLLGTFKIEGSISEFVKNNTQSYYLKKRNNSNRRITVPNLKLKKIQQWIVKNIMNHVLLSESAHGFVQNKSIFSNASAHIHTNENWLLRVDIKNFFPSIKQENVRMIFEELGYESQICIALAQLCTMDDELSQGFPTSPVLSNIYLKEFDNMINQFLTTFYPHFDIVYTRYADDIFISGLKIDNYERVIKDIKRKIKYFLNSQNLLINNKKTRVQLNERKFITGLYIEGSHISISKRYIREIESDIYYCKKYGVISHLSYHNKLSIANFRGYMYGRVSFIKMVSHEIYNRLLSELNEIDWPL